MKPRTSYDALGTNEIIVRCLCDDAGTAVVMSLSAFMKMGRARALEVAEGMCETCCAKAAS